MGGVLAKLIKYRDFQCAEVGQKIANAMFHRCGHSVPIWLIQLFFFKPGDDPLLQIYVCAFFIAHNRSDPNRQIHLLLRHFGCDCLVYLCPTNSISAKLDVAVKVGRSVPPIEKIFAALSLQTTNSIEWMQGDEDVIINSAPPGQYRHVKARVRN